MKSSYDENTLSAFMDAELDLQSMYDVDEFVGNTPEAQQLLLQMVRKNALLKAASNEVLHEPIPQRLLETVRADESAPLATSRWPGLVRVAAVFVLMLIGYGAGTHIGSRNVASPAFTASVLPQQYQDVVDAAMEHNLSGNSLAWENKKRSDFRVVVTPVRSYQDKDGKYYREYRLEMAAEKERVVFRGLAHRTGKAQWKTTALFF